MVRGNLNGLILRSGWTLAAAMMMTTAVMAQDSSATGGDAATISADAVDGGGVVNWDDPSPGSEGIAVGEPDPNGGGELDGATDDRTDETTVDDGSGDGTDGWVDDGTDGGSDGTGDDGTGDGSDDWVDDGTGDGSDGTGEDGTVDDGTGDGTDDWVDDGSGDGSDGSGEDGTVDDGTGDGSVDWVDDGTVVDEGEVVIDYLDGGPVQCDDCDVTAWDLPLEAYQMGEGALGEDAPQAAQNDAPAARSKRSSSRTFAASGMADCLLQHPQLPWICEWQNGVGH